jgi:hypothetical protein
MTLEIVAARMLIGTYGLDDRENIARALREQFPAVDAEALIDRAARELEESRENDRAVVAEHDLGETMYREEKHGD